MPPRDKNSPKTMVERAITKQSQNEERQKPVSIKDQIKRCVESDDLKGLLDLRDEIFQEIKVEIKDFDLLDPEQLKPINKIIYSSAGDFWDSDNVRDYLRRFQIARDVCDAITKLIRKDREFAKEVTMDEYHQKIKKAITMTRLQLTAIDAWIKLLRN